MKKIGILTLHSTENYGATLQAYGLWKFIKDLDYEVEFIDYRPYKLIKAYVKHLYWNRHFVHNGLKSWRMRKFLLSEVQLSKTTFYTSNQLRCCEHQYDAVICGSDEIWNINSPLLGFDPSYLLDFISERNTPKIAYAVSFGYTTQLNSNAEQFSRLLKNFNHISVRDRNSLRLVTEECGLQAVKVVDPTFLIDFTQIMQSPRETNYILVYGILSEREANYVLSIAQSENLSIISIGYYCQVAKKNLLSIEPGEWIGYFAKASHIFTSFYHGAIFSIIFKKPFNVFSRDSKSAKVRDLLSELGLECKIIKTEILNGHRPRLNIKIDFDAVDIKLNKMIVFSKTYLYQCLNVAKVNNLP